MNQNQLKGSSNFIGRWKTDTAARCVYCSPRGVKNFAQKKKYNKGDLLCGFAYSLRETIRNSKKKQLTSKTLIFLLCDSMTICTMSSI